MIKIRIPIATELVVKKSIKNNLPLVTNAIELFFFPIRITYKAVIILIKAIMIKSQNPLPRLCKVPGFIKLSMALYIIKQPTPIIKLP